MTEPKSGTRTGARKPRGGKALLGVAMAILGAMAGVHPANTLLVALNEVVPQLAAALPTVITACGAILAAVSEPPGVGRKEF